METPKTVWCRKRKLQPCIALLNAAKLSQSPPSPTANKDPLPPFPESPEGVREPSNPTSEPQEGRSLRVCDYMPSMSLDDSLQAICTQLIDSSSNGSSDDDACFTNDNVRQVYDKWLKVKQKAVSQLWLSWSWTCS